MGSPIASAQLIGTFLEVAAYSVYATLVPRAYAVLRGKGSHGFLLKYLHFTLFATLLANTVHVFASVGRIIYAYTTHIDQAGFAEAYLSRLDLAPYMLKSICVAIVVVLADALIVLRTYVIWDKRRRIIILPALLLLADLAHSIEVVVVVSINRFLLITPSLIVFSAVTLALNLLCSGLIAYRLWSSLRILREYFSNAGAHLHKALVIIIESSVMYSIVSIISLVATVYSGTLILGISDLIPSVVGITFLYVIISSSNFQQSTTVSAADSWAVNVHAHELSSHRPEPGILSTRPRSPESDVVVQITLEKLVQRDDPETYGVGK